tara:strand:- start:482 stop:1120 length:639 start_codon:yes stop_codon:yes gene_type:complete
MTNHEYKFIFIHYPKTGGSSIESFFGGSDGPKTTHYKDSKGRKRTTWEKHHMPAQEYIAENGHEIWDDYFTFTIIRNPWDMFVSHFEWDVHVYNESAKLGKLQKPRREFIVEKCGSDFTTYIEKGSQKPKWFKFHIQKEFSQNVQYYARFENLQQDFEKICSIIKVTPGILPHKKKIKDRPHYTEYYNDKTRKIVEELFQPDIDHFNYKFGE